MPAALTYPGVRIEELPSGVRTITGVATSITAFVGRARRGPVDEPVRVHSFPEFSRIFGGLWQPSSLGYAVNQFFQHGGSDALIVRVANAADSASLQLATSGDPLTLEAASPGAWGNLLRAGVDHETRDEDDDSLFNLLVEEISAPGGSTVVTSEQYLNVSADPASPRFVRTVLEQQSALVRVTTNAADVARPNETTDPVAILDGNGDLIAPAAEGSDGDPIENEQVTPADASTRQGIYALDTADLFNLLCIPPLTRDNDSDSDVSNESWARAARYCQQRRALLLIDPPSGWVDVSDATDDSTGINDLRSDIGNDLARNVAVYFPRLRMADPLAENRLAGFAPCGAIAGIISRTDAQRGVWKAPAGFDASFSGVQGFSYTMTDAQNGEINPLGLNALRSFPVSGNLVWGARTLAGADQLASEWKYLPVRRTALFLEESLFRGTQWVVFEPNDEPLWAQIRLNIGAFMQNLFRQGAFQGASPREAYFVKCDSETTTQNDIDRGVVNILVGWAPLKPAEFVIVQIQQIAGDIQV